jgi:hypothetical protein
MKRIVVIMALVFCFTATAQAGWLDKIKEAAPDSIKQKVQDQTGGEAQPTVPSGSPAISGISPDQQDANACSAYVHEDWKKSEKALKESNLTWGSSRYLPKKEWIDYLTGRYPNVKREKNDFYVHFGKWFGNSCAYVDLKCVPKEPGCDASMKCLDFYTRKGGLTCPPNLCSQDDKKCIEPYKAPVK